MSSLNDFFCIAFYSYYVFGNAKFTIAVKIGQHERDVITPSNA